MCHLYLTISFRHEEFTNEMSPPVLRWVGHANARAWAQLFRNETTVIGGSNQQSHWGYDGDNMGIMLSDHHPNSKGWKKHV